MADVVWTITGKQPGMRITVTLLQDPFHFLPGLGGEATIP